MLKLTIGISVCLIPKTFMSFSNVTDHDSGIFNFGDFPAVGATDLSNLEGDFSTLLFLSAIFTSTFSLITSSTIAAFLELLAANSNFPLGTKLVITYGLSFIYLLYTLIISFLVTFLMFSISSVIKPGSPAKTLY